MSISRDAVICVTVTAIEVGGCVAAVEFAAHGWIVVGFLVAFATVMLAYTEGRVAQAFSDAKRGRL